MAVTFRNSRGHILLRFEHGSDFHLNDILMPPDANRCSSISCFLQSRIAIGFHKFLDEFINMDVCELLSDRSGKYLSDIASLSKAFFRLVIKFIVAILADSLKCHVEHRGFNFWTLGHFHRFYGPFDRVEVFHNVYCFWFILADFLTDCRHGDMDDDPLHRFNCSAIMFMRLLMYPGMFSHPLYAVRTRLIPGSPTFYIEPNKWYVDG